MVITNARIVARDTEFVGSVHVMRAVLAAVDQSLSSTPGAEDWDGDYLMPGLIELHTDNLEKHVMPRPGVHWPLLSALIAHDAQVAAAGITTVFDALALGDLDGKSVRAEMTLPFAQTLELARRRELLRADHLLHLRCEVAVPNALDMFHGFAGNPLVRLVSVMDHTPGQRQWTDLDKFRQYTERHGGFSDARFQEILDERRALQATHAIDNRTALLHACRARDVPLASHDDTLAEHVEQAVADGIAISEFPTSLDAARHARERSMAILMGAPNVVRGGSHSGNVSALQLAQAGLLDGLSSDYVPASLLHAAFLLRTQAGWELPRALAAVTANPADMVRLVDRGEIAPGKRADFIRVREADGIPVVLGAWREGERIF